MGDPDIIMRSPIEFDGLNIDIFLGNLRGFHGKCIPVLQFQGYFLQQWWVGMKSLLNKARNGRVFYNPAEFNE